MGASKRYQYSEQTNFLAEIGKAVGHSARVTILHHLYHNRSAQGLDLMRVTELSESNVSRHVHVLKAAGLVTEVWRNLQYFELTNDARERVESLMEIFGEARLMKTSQSN